jgi:hypothetical protein
MRLLLCMSMIVYNRNIKWIDSLLNGPYNVLFYIYNTILKLYVLLFRTVVVLLTNINCQIKQLFVKRNTIVHKIVYGCCFLSLPLFLYTLVIIVSYTAYIIVYVFYYMWWALVTSPTETAGSVIFVSGGIVFVCKIVNDGISFYKELFNLTIDVCQQHDDCT